MVTESKDLFLPLKKIFKDRRMSTNARDKLQEKKRLRKKPEDNLPIGNWKKKRTQKKNRKQENNFDIVIIEMEEK